MSEKELTDEELDNLFTEEKRKEKLEFVKQKADERKKAKEELEKKEYIEANKAKWEEEAKQKLLEREKPDNADPASIITPSPTHMKTSEDYTISKNKGAKDGKDFAAYYKYVMGYTDPKYSWKKEWKQPRDYEDMVQRPFEFTDSDSGCDADVSAWSPDDTYANIVWRALLCTANLQKICVSGIDIDKGDGMSVQIRTVAKFAAPSSYTACECISCTSNTFTTHTLTLSQLGFGTEICEYDIWDVGEVYRTQALLAMGERWAEYFDAQIYSELETATPGYTETLPTGLSCSPSISGACCTNADAMNLYHAFVDLVATMREAAYKPDYAIMAPSIAAYFKYKDGVHVPSWIDTEVVIENGVLMRVAGVNVIEYCGANTCTNLSAQELIIVIDSRRAVGQAFGMRPKMYSDFDIDCNSTTYTFWCFWAVAELDTNAIGHIVNP